MSVSLSVLDVDLKSARPLVSEGLSVKDRLSLEALGTVCQPVLLQIFGPSPSLLDRQTGSPLGTQCEH